MTTRMLIDARHQEETRVAVLKGNRIEEFDFESADHEQIKGNIYLAKVTRVEPSLQAAFVDFGGNRHGFLAFSEIHPDYYQIPKEDREALLAEEARHAEEEAALRAVDDDDDEDEFGDNEGFAGDSYEGAYDDGHGVTEVDTSDKGQVATIEGGVIENGYDNDADDGDEGESAGNDTGEGESGDPRRGRRQRRQGRGQSREADDLRARRMALRRRYKIQDVIQRRQVLLVQVVKEERGNKGAALTTYLSLAGRYCVLMPNSSHGGGISRKINSATDRKRLKSIITELELPKSMSCIVRTAGLQRTKPEIKRDFDYLARLWDEIRERTIRSSAPALIHSDSDLVKRAIRDIYNREIEEVVVEGDEGYRDARDFMKLLMPSHARRVKQYVDPVPLFQRYGAEDQLTAMYDPVVQLKSGGYLVINPTEALVSIDINSGRSTKEHGIEATAVSTNLEAAREIARQLRLRDMAGLVVIDFIDMEYGSNVRKVEKAVKEALKDDRARIQVGRISGFGLMEMSRQRLRTGVLEATTRACPHCDGSGLVRTASSAGLSALRMIEDEAAKGKGTVISLYASQEAAIYVLNTKRADLAEIEVRYGVIVEVIPEGENEGAKMRVASRGPRPEFVPRFEPIRAPVEEEDDYVDEDEYEDEEAEADSAADAGADRTARAAQRTDDGEGERGDGDRNGTRRKRRKRRRNRNRGQDDAQGQSEGGNDEGDRDETGGFDDEADETDEAGDQAEVQGSDGDESEAGESESGEFEDGPAAENGGEGRRKRRRRGRRRRGRDTGNAGDEAGETGSDEAGDEARGEAEPETAADTTPVEPVATVESPEPETAAVEELPAKPRRGRRRKADVEATVTETAPAVVEAVVTEVAEPAPVAEAPAAEEAPAKPRRGRRKKVDIEAEARTLSEAPAEPVAEVPAEAPAKPKRTRRKKAEDAPVVAETASDDAAAPVSEPPAPEPAVTEPTPAASAEDAGSETRPATGEDGDEANGPRRGWWQRTFGA